MPPSSPVTVTVTAFWRMVAATASVVLVLGLGLRQLAWTDPVLVGAVGFAPLVLAAAAVAALAAAWPARSRPLQGLVVVSVVAYLVVFVSPRAVVGCGPEEAPDEIVVYTHNLRWDNNDVETIAAAVAAAKPDVVVLQEARRETQKKLLAQDALAPLAFSTTAELDELAELAIWSRWPLDDVRLDQVAGRPLLAATVQSPHGAFRVHDTHLAAPIDRAAGARWAAGLESLLAIELAEPSIIAGDFNATDDHAQFRRLMDQGWTDAHEDKGCGFDRTWPDGGRLGGPLLQLDHVLVSPHWEVLSLDIGDAAGSDHRAVTATIRLANQRDGG